MWARIMDIFNRLRNWSKGSNRAELRIGKLLLLTLPAVCGCCFLSSLLFVVVPAADQRTVVAQGAQLMTTVEPTAPTTSHLSLLINPHLSSPPVTQDCTPDYSPCLTPGLDFDCHGGDGPRYVPGPVFIDHIFGDPYELDRDGDGVGCELPATE